MIHIQKLFYLSPALQIRLHTDPIWSSSAAFRIALQPRHRLRWNIKGHRVAQNLTMHEMTTYTKWVEFSIIALISCARRLNNFCPITILTFIGENLAKIRSTTPFTSLNSGLASPKSSLSMVGKYLLCIGKMLQNIEKNAWWQAIPDMPFCATSFSSGSQPCPLCWPCLWSP